MSFIPAIFVIFVITTNCANIHVAITGNCILLYVWIIICFDLYFSRFLHFSNFLPLFSLISF